MHSLPAPSLYNTFFFFFRSNGNRILKVSGGGYYSVRLAEVAQNVKDMKVFYVDSVEESKSKSDLTWIRFNLLWLFPALLRLFRSE